LIQDSFRLQTLLPLLKLSDAIQAGKGAETITEQALEVAAKEIKPGRLQLWLNQTGYGLKRLTGIDHIPDMPQSFSITDLEAVMERNEILWKSKRGDLSWAKIEPRQAVAICLPLLTKGQSLGILTAAVRPEAVPLSSFQIELLQILSRQLAGAIENINLFNRVQSLSVFNQSIIANITTGLIALDQVGRVTVCNRAAAALLGLQSDEVMGQPVEKALSRFPQLVTLYLDALAGPPTVTHRDLDIEHWDGGTLTVTITTSPLYNVEGQITGIIGLIEDLTELRMLEAERRRLDRLAALGEMSAVVAHELRNPIAGIAAGVEYLTKRLDLNATDYQGSQMILKEIDRVHRIVEDILLVARPLELHRSFHSIVQIIQNILGRHRTALTKTQIRVKLVGFDDLPLLLLDSARMEQVFDNLVGNAIHAMPEGGSITIAADLLPAQEQVIIVFKDTGHGIHAAEQQKIFEPFFTTKTRGVGLGLALSRRIMEAHGGGISIRETGPDGTHFEVKLPLTKPMEQPL
jgi:PAS domain S-box-containing protein